jgi:hypothetical protein
MNCDIRQKYIRYLKSYQKKKKKKKTEKEKKIEKQQRHVMRKRNNIVLACEVRSNLSSGREVRNYQDKKAVTCFLCHPHKIPAEIFSRQQEKI